MGYRSVPTTRDSGPNRKIVGFGRSSSLFEMRRFSTVPKCYDLKIRRKRVGLKRVRRLVLCCRTK